MFPWESIPCLRDKSVSRMPNFTLTLNALQKHGHSLQVDSCHTFYLLNPSGDLLHTEKEFQGFVW